MKLCFFDDHRLGLVEGDGVRDVTAAIAALEAARYPFAVHDVFVADLPGVCERITNLVDDGRRCALSKILLLPPVLNPGKLVAAPVNYQAHLDEAIEDEEIFSRAHIRKIQETGLFLKATSSLIGVGAPIVIAHPDRRTDHEIELAAIIGRKCYRARRTDALSYVAGYTIGLDITIRGPEERSLRKSLDSYSVLGPWLVTADEFGDPSGREMKLDIDGELRQHANTRDLIMDVADLIAFASSYYTLMPGDVIFTGTPEGVGPIRPGNRINAEIQGIGSLSMEVRGID